MRDDLLVVGRQPEGVQVSAEGAHEILDLVLHQVGGVARHRQLLGQLVGQREEVTLHLDRLFPPARHPRQTEDLLLRLVIARLDGEAAERLVERRRRIAHPLLTHLGPQSQKLDPLLGLGARPRHLGVDVEQPFPISGALRQPLQVVQELVAGLAP